MDPNVVANHRLASESAVRFLDYSIANGGCLKRLDLLDDTLPRFLRNYPYPVHSWPWFIGEELRKTLAECVTRIPALVCKALRIEFGRDSRRLAQFFDIPEILAEIFLGSGLGAEQFMVRIDAVMTASGLKIMEINAGPDIGGWQIHWMDGLYRKNAALRPFLETNDCRTINIPRAYMDHLVARALACSGGVSANVALVMQREEASLDVFETLRAVFEETMVDVNVPGRLYFETGFDHFTFGPTGMMRGNERIGTVVLFRDGTDITPPLDLHRTFLRGDVYWPDNPFVALVGDKRSLAIAYQSRGNPAFTGDERAVIESYIPWCAASACGQLEGHKATMPVDELVSRQDQLVIKTARGARGDDVFVGRFQTADAWQGVVARAESEPGWLAQEYCSSLPFYGQMGEEGYGIHDVIWGVFGFGGSYGGCWLRLSPKDLGDGVINSAKGAQETIVYEVSD